MASFDYLVRFEDEHGNVLYGHATANDLRSELEGQSLNIYDGSVPWDAGFTLSNRNGKVCKVLSPLASTPIIHGVGLNYKAHADEGNMKLPPYPILFVKFPDALANPYDDIPVNKEAWQLDYEGELCVVIGKDCNNLSATDNPLDYVLGYAVGNDVSSRYWQDRIRASGQHGYAKSMDKFAPLGPVIASTRVIPDPSRLQLTTHVNGELRQQSGTDNMIFDVPTLIRHSSRGITLRAGTVIMTGTPEGVAAFIKPSPWLKNGDVVEIEISSIGKIRNKMVFEDERSAPPDDSAPAFGQSQLLVELRLETRGKLL